MLALLAWVLRLQRDYPAALDAADAAIEADPYLADAYAERSESLVALVRSADAVEAAREAVRIEPYTPSGHFVLSRALVAAHELDHARTAALTGLSLAPRSVEGLLTLADVEREAGRREEATTAARTALAIDPGNTYGRWLIAMLDAEKLRVRRSMRALRDVARDNPARPDVVSMTWPIRGVLSGLRRGLTLGALLVCVLLPLTRWYDVARVLSAVLVVVMAGFALRVLVPAGRLPWRCLAMVPRLTRRGTVAGLVTAGAATGLLAVHAITGWWVAAVLALAAAPVLWLAGFLELLGTGLDDPGFRHALTDVFREFRDWWRTTRKELRDIWRE